jgi:hypothetical protein
MRLLAVFTLWLALAVAPLAAQTPTPTPIPQAQPQPQAESAGPMPWVIGALCTLAILLIVCMPSRKSQT